MSNQITCPSCNHSFEAGDALSSQIKSELEAQLKTEFGQKLKQEKQKIEEGLKQKIELEMQGKIDSQMKNLQDQNSQNQKRIVEFGQREQELELKAQELVESKTKLELKTQQKLENLEKLETEMIQKMQNKLEIEKKLITNQIKEEENERTRLEIAEKNKQLDQLRKSLEEANRKASQGSQQTQGDIQENDLKQILTTGFPNDLIEDVPTGVRGADLVQTVFGNGKNCGKIIWESKRTQSWSESWVQKLKEDKARVQGDIAIIATQSLPDGIKSHSNYKGIWVVQYNSAYILALTCTIRHFLQEMNQIKNSQIGKSDKMEYLYNYLISSQFRGKIENIVEAFSNMKNDLDSEKRAMTKIWSKREKEINRVIDSTSSMYGDLGGIIGAKLEKIESLELDSCF